ncbi:MAG: UDP-N-acetylmuramate dehydrogenase [Clostridia bacterium]|nr:UDP-N-acetylmuramate dehydrogenase [Clostridia bacterium]
MTDLSFLSALDANIVFDHPSLSAFGSGGDIAAVIYPATAKQLVQATALLDREKIPYFILGNCTNVLIKDEGIDGVVICTKYLCGIEVKDDLLYVAAGESMPKLCKLSLEGSLSGLEGLCSIPGTVGGGVIMNCSAFGREFADVIEYVDIVQGGEIVRYSAQDLDFGYRYSKAKSLGAVIGAGIKLKSGDKRKIANDIKGYKIARGRSQPQGISLGSVFKQVDGVSAGYYIDKAGLKGMRIGGAKISEKHANFILNVDRATSADFLELGNYARQEVDKLWGVGLQYEIDII